MKKILALLNCIFLPIKIFGSELSLVYNLRVTETISLQKINEESDKPFTISSLFFDQFRKRLDNTKERVLAGLQTFIYSPENYYFRVDFAAGNVMSKKNSCQFSRTQTDDILFTAGYGYKINDYNSVTFSGLFGLPTHKDLVLENIQFGYAHIGLGAQIDGTLIYTSNKKSLLRPAIRFIHFFQRSARYKEKCFKFVLGNLVDLFIANHTNFGKHGFEFGYDASFFFGAKIHPYFKDATDSYIFSTFYASYDYNFLIKKIKNSIALSFSYGLSHIPKNALGFKRLIASWASWAVDF